MNDYADTFGAVWTALASVVRTESPSTQAVAAFRSPALLEQWPLNDDSELLTRALRALRSSREDEAELNDDHFRLLRGPGKPIAAPWESVHLSEAQLLFEDETMAVRQWYRRYGLQAPRLNVEPDDHICLELDFAAELLRRALDAPSQEEARALVDAHDQFCREHLLLWAPAVFEALATGARTSFYLGIGLLGKHALVRLQAEIGDE